MSKDYSVTISRNSKGTVGIFVRDEISRITFLELDLTLEDFAWLITGLSEVKAEGKTKGLEYVGKNKVKEERFVKVPEDIKYNRSKIEDWLEANCQEDGWLLDTYLGGKDSVQNGVVKYSVYKYV